MRISILILSLMLTNVMIACSKTPSNATSGSSTSTNSSKSAALSVSNGHLVDAGGFALYTTPSACTGSCLTVWPPMTASTTPVASGGLSQGNIGLQSGQVTYKGSLLYYFVSDTSPGQATGNGVGGFVLAAP